jgi:hypothetical protein
MRNQPNRYEKELRIKFHFRLEGKWAVYDFEQKATSAEFWPSRWKYLEEQGASLFHQSG